MKSKLFVVSIFLMAVYMGCGKQDTSESIVVWAELKVMDELTVKAMRETNAAAFQEVSQELFHSAKLVVESETPKNARKLEQVQVLLEDLNGLIEDEVLSLSNEELKERAQAIHTMGAKIMEAAGMPHVHDHED